MRGSANVAIVLVLACACSSGWEGDAPGVSRAAPAEGGESAAAVAPPASDDVRFEPMDEAHSGELADGDFVLEVDGSLYDEFAFETVAGASVVVTMRSTALEPYVHVIGPGGAQLAHGGPTADQPGVAELALVAPADGEYRVYANAAEPPMRGAYDLRIVVDPPPREAPERE